MWTILHKQIFTEIISKFETNEIQYFVYRNYKELPDNIPTNDIDIIINPKQYKTAVSLLFDVYRQNNIKHVKIKKFGVVMNFYGIINLEQIIEIDLLKGCIVQGGYELFPFNFLSDKRIRYHNFYVLPSYLEAILLVFYKVLGWNKIKPQYVEEIQNVIINDFDNFYHTFCQFFNKKNAQLFIECFKQNRIADFTQKAPYLKLKFQRRNWLRKPFTTIKWFFIYKIQRFKDLFNNQLICVEAPDGTGKTTFIENLSSKLCTLFNLSEKDFLAIKHFRPLYLPNLGAVGEKAGMMKQDINFTKPHRAQPVGIFSSFIRMTYYWLDYIIGMPIILQKNERSHKITIFDRYIYDFLVDPRRSRINLPYWLRKCFTKLVKQPKIVFVLDAPADVIYKRKQELTPEEISRQLVEYRKLSSLGKRYYRLDASQKPEEIANDAIKIILDNFTKKL